VAQRLVEAYAASLDIDLGFQDFQHEITSLQRAYGPPAGAFLVAEQDGMGIGCVALRQFAQNTCEMKRLYVSPDGRSQGVGRALAEGIISEARRLGYARMLLDTPGATVSAQGEALPFHARGAQPVCSAWVQADSGVPVQSGA